MNRRDVKTRPEHRQFIRSLTRISFFFSYDWQRKHPEETISEVLTSRSPLLIHAFCLRGNEGESHPAWQALLARAESAVKEANNATEFEQVMFAAPRDFAEERAERFYSQSIGVSVPKGWNVGSLKYDPPKESLPPNYCNFHISNALAPRSILDDPKHIPSCFLELMERSEAEYGYDMLHTSTWLNDHPAWLAFFPQEWHDNLGPRSETIHGNFGFWGQVVNARGTFNEKAGRHLRKHGELRYKPRHSHCSFQAMREHLRELLESIG